MIPCIHKQMKYWNITQNCHIDILKVRFIGNSCQLIFLVAGCSDIYSRFCSLQLGSLLKVIIDKQKKKVEDGGTLFDPKCAIFVCNLWDNVKTEEQDQVYDYAVRKLENYWPGLVKTSVIRFSAKRAKEELALDRDYITKDYKMFLDCLKELVATATDKRVKATYK